VIAGQVLDAATGRPIPGAIVSLTTTASALAAVGVTNPVELPEMAVVSGPNVPIRVMTNADGRFVYRNLPKGRFAFSASATGYLLGSYGQRRAGGPGTGLDLEDGEKLLDAVFRLWKAGTISGMVVDETGEPVIGVGVRVLRRTIVTGRTRWSPSLTTTTDDRGIYRFASLTPGDYAVAAISTTSSLPLGMIEAYREAITAVGVSGSTNASNLIRDLSASGAPFPTTSGIRVGDQMLQQSPFGRVAIAPTPSDASRMLSYPTTYHPASISPSQLTVITLESGEERTGADIQLRLVPTAKVSGVVTGPDGPVANIGVRLLPAGLDDFSNEVGLETAATATDGRGAFTLLGVPSGAFSVKVLKTPRPQTPGASENMVMVSSAGGMSVATSVGLTAPIPPPLPTEPTLWGAATVSVGDTDVSGVSVTLREGARIIGRVEFDGTRPPPAADQIQRMAVSLQPLDAHRQSGHAWARDARPSVPHDGLRAGSISGQRHRARIGLDVEIGHARRPGRRRRATRSWRRRCRRNRAHLHRSPRADYRHRAQRAEPGRRGRRRARLPRQSPALERGRQSAARAQYQDDEDRRIHPAGPAAR
jgi:hypothetical protein